MLNEYFIPFKGIKRKTVCHFSDTHLTEYDALSTEAEKERAIKQTAAWENVRRGYCEGYGETYGEFERKSPKEHFLYLLGAAKECDALVVAGDTLDYVSPANLRLYESEMASFPKPFAAVCGNHDLAENLPETGAASLMRRPVQTIDLGDMTVAAFDDSKRLITETQIETLKELLAAGKPLLIAMHVPIMTDGNRERLLKAGEYFRLNYDGCPETNLEFIDILKKNASGIIAVLAGHLHFSDVSEIAPGLTQYVTSQGVVGNLNRYIIGE